MPEIEDQIKLKTGGISVSPFVSANHSNLDIAEEGLSFSGYCLDRNVPDMYGLLQKVLLETNFNQPTKLGTMIQGTASGLINNLAESGHSYARTFAAAHLTKAGKIVEVTGGMTQVRLLSKIAADQNYGEAILRLKEIAEFAASRENLRVALTCSSDVVADNERHLASFVSSLPKKAAPVSTLAGFEFDQGTTRAFFPLPFQVNYSSLCLKTVPYTHNDSAALSVLSQLLTHKYLHHEIREKGGAYGGGSFQNSVGGVFGYYSYRDPNIPNTLKVIGESGSFALEHHWTAEELEGAKLSIFQGIDAPQSINEEGMTLFTVGITDDMRQKYV
jgi:presequence protease